MKGFLKTFDPTHGTIGAVGMGTVLFLINMHEGAGAGAQAALAQAVISFLIVGTNTGVFKKLRDDRKISAVMIPTVFTTFVASVIHFMTGTPEFLWSIVSVFFLGAFHFVMLSLIYARYGTIDPKTLFSR